VRRAFGCRRIGMQRGLGALVSPARRGTPLPLLAESRRVSSPPTGLERALRAAIQLYARACRSIVRAIRTIWALGQSLSRLRGAAVVPPQSRVARPETATGPRPVRPDRQAARSTRHAADPGCARWIRLLPASSCETAVRYRSARGGSNASAL